MIEVDKKITKYLETKKMALSLRKEVENLHNLIDSLEEAIADENKLTMTLENEVITSVRVGDLRDKISKILRIDREDIDIKITVISGIYASNIQELYDYKREDAAALNSYLKINLKNGTKICNQNLRLFNDLKEIEADGYILLRHCKLEPATCQRRNLVIDKNIDDIICNFRLDAIDIDRYNGLEKVLPMAVRGCIHDEKIEEELKIKEKNLVKK